MTAWLELIVAFLQDGDIQVERSAKEPPDNIPIPVGELTPPFRLSVEIEPGPWYQCSTLQYASRDAGEVWTEHAWGRSLGLRTITKQSTWEYGRLDRWIRHGSVGGPPTGVGK